MIQFSGSFARWRCCEKNLENLEIDQGLLAHTPNGDAGPPPLRKKNNRENLKFGLKFSVLGSVTFGLLGVSLWNFLQSTSHEAGVINWVQFLEGPPPKIWEGKKSSKIRRDFWQLSTLIANISGMDPHIENRKSWCTLVHKRKSHWA